MLGGELAGVTTIGGLAAVVNRSISAADAIGKTADKIGVGVEALHELRFVAKASGVEQQTLDMALQRFTRRAAEAAQGTGEAKYALAQPGVTLRDQDGHLRRSEDPLADVADAFARIEGAARLQALEAPARLARRGHDPRRYVAELRGMAQRLQMTVGEVYRFGCQFTGAEALDEAYVLFFGAFGVAWDDAMVARWSGNPLGMVWSERDVAALLGDDDGGGPPAAARRPVVIIAARPLVDERS